MSTGNCRWVTSDTEVKLITSVDDGVLDAACHSETHNVQDCIEEGN